MVDLDNSAYEESLDSQPIPNKHIWVEAETLSLTLLFLFFNYSKT